MLKLLGCNPYPLSSYLKALGVFSLIVEQHQQQNIKAYWLDDSFVLDTKMTSDSVLDFFLYSYQPTPLVAPWNRSTGFSPQDNQKTINAIIESTAKRLQIYRETVIVAQTLVSQQKLSGKPQKKRDLLEQLRNNLPDPAVKWLDTCTLITDEKLQFPPLAGTGGNDGNFEFSRTFMQQLQELFDFKTGQPINHQVQLMLRAALFADIVPGLKFTGKIGQFNPIAAGGANAAPGYDAPSRVNPWDYVLMLEGMMLLDSGATRRYESQEQGNMSYPFTVRQSSVGYGSAADGDEVRAELWLPLWRAPTGLKELQFLFKEGRAKVGKKTAQNGIDFARAISSQGVKRGISEFIRYSFQVRNGQSYFAIYAGRFQPQINQRVNRLIELDGWVSKFSRDVESSRVPNGIKLLKRRLDTTIFEFSLGKKKLLDVVIALGDVEANLNKSPSFAKQAPLKPLNRHWIRDCDDNSVEFRLALALASRNLRPRLVRVRQQGEKMAWNNNDDGMTTWRIGSLTDNLIGLLQREEIESQQENLSSGSEQKKRENLVTVQLSDIYAWIWGKVDDVRIEKIARGLSLVNIDNPHWINSQVNRSNPSIPIPAAFSIAKIVHHRVFKPAILKKFFPHSQINFDKKLPRVPGMLHRLAIGDCTTAINLALQRLRASGFNPAISLDVINEPPETTQRIAAALVFPISDWNMACLLKRITKT